MTKYLVILIAINLQILLNHLNKQKKERKKKERKKVM